MTPVTRLWPPDGTTPNMAGGCQPTATSAAAVMAGSHCPPTRTTLADPSGAAARPIQTERKITMTVDFRDDPTRIAAATRAIAEQWPESWSSPQEMAADPLPPGCVSLEWDEFSTWRRIWCEDGTCRRVPDGIELAVPYENYDNRTRRPAAA